MLYGKVIYYCFCYMMWILNEWELFFVLLDYVKGLEMIFLGYFENCCGFGGMFLVKMLVIFE